MDVSPDPDLRYEPKLRPARQMERWHVALIGIGLCIFGLGGNLPAASGITGTERIGRSIAITFTMLWLSAILALISSTFLKNWKIVFFLSYLLMVGLNFARNNVWHY